MNSYQHRILGQRGQATSEYLLTTAMVVALVLIAGGLLKNFMPGLFGQVFGLIGSSGMAGSSGGGGSTGSQSGGSGKGGAGRPWYAGILGGKVVLDDEDTGLYALTQLVDLSGKVGLLPKTDPGIKAVPGGTKWD